VAEVVPPGRQREALRAVLDTIRVEELLLPRPILDLIPPRAFGYGDPPVELFDKRTDLVFDPVAAATIAADIAVSGLLQPERAARLFEYHSRNEANPEFDEVVRALLRQTWYYAPADKPKDGRAAAVVEAVQDLVVMRLMDLASNPDASPAVRAVAGGRLRNLRDNLKLRAVNNVTVGAGLSGDHLNMALEDIDRFLARPDAPYKRTAPLAVPPGDPIGGRIR
jgi:Met-zincin